MSDIVQRLRESAQGWADADEPENAAWENEAADTIEAQGKRIADLEAEIARLKAGPTEDELDTAHSEGYEEGYSEGQGDAKSAHADLRSMLLGHLKKHDCEPASDDGQGHNAEQVMDAVFDREANIRADGKRLAEAENVRLRAALRGFMDRQRVLDVLADGDDFPDTYVINVGCSLGDYRRARKELLGGLS